MKNFLLLISVFFVSLGFTFAISQPVNETNGVNYGYIKSIYKKWSNYILSVDYIQYYQSYEAALARAEDGVIFGDHPVDYNQNYPTSYFTTNSNGEKLATKVIRKKITAYLTKNGKKWREQLIAKLSNYEWPIPSTIFNSLTEVERMIVWPSFDPAIWWGWDYVRNTSTKIRNVQFSSSTKITVEGVSMSIEELFNWAKSPTQNLVKVFIKKGKIEWFRVEYHP